MSAHLRTAESRNALRLGISISLLLFYFQALRVIFSVQFGIIYDQIFEGPLTSWLVVSVLLLLTSLVVPFLIPIHLAERFYLQIIVLAVLLRIPMTINHPAVRFWSALGTLFSIGMFISLLLRSNRGGLFLAAVGAVCLDQTLRILGHTFDVSLRAYWLPVQALWSLLVLVPLFLLDGVRKPDPAGEGGLPWTGGLALGGFLFLQSSLLGLPNALARWADVRYEIIAPSLMLVSALPLFPTFRGWMVRGAQERLWRLALAALLFLPLAGYFTQGWLAGFALLISQLAALLSLGIILLDGRSLQHNASAAIGMLLFLGMVFLNAFAFTYPYTLPVMREKGWLVYLFASLLLGAGVLTAKVPAAMGKRPIRFRVAEPGLGFGLLISLVTVGAFVWPQPAEPLEGGESLTLASYNIHYGYDQLWHLSLEAQAETIRQAGVEAIALQEVDTGRLTSYGIDDAYFLGRALGMNVAYLPTVEHLTGIAVLYKGPKAPEGSRLLTSLEEQTGIVGVSLDANKAADAYGIWVGLEAEDTLRQVEQAIEFIADRPVVSWGGDFNADPDSEEVGAILEAGFIDPFAALGIEPAPNTSPAINPEKRIDFVFLRGMVPREAYVSDSLASDHRMVVVEAEPLR